MHRVVLSILLVGTAFAGETRVDTNEGTPLLSVSLSLQLARARIMEARPEAAAGALRDAARHLTAVEGLFPGPDAGEAEYIRQQILEQSGRIYDKPSEIIDRIDYLWLRPVNHWLNRAGK